MRGSEFTELRAFVAVAERENFSRAAIHLGIAPSTLSQTIRSLEERLGVRLLHRTTRSVSLTDAGIHLLARVRPAFEELSLAVESINDFRDAPMGTLRLSVSTIPAQMILAPLLKEFLATYPDILLEITVNDADIDIVKSKFDAGIRYGKRIAQDMLLVKACPPSRLIAMASPEYLAQYGVPEKPQDLQHHRCIRYRYESLALLPWTFEENRKIMEIEVSGALIVNDVDLMIKATRDGIGIGYMAESYIVDDLREGRLVPLLTEWSPAYNSWYLYYAGHRQLPAPLKAFIRFLRVHADAGQDPDSGSTGPD
ncbi:MAG: LysR family transcriptional regulator [Halothiobacillus sp.]|jgi:DNA-binding transcriptional LysR family regulator|nr:LysR family transcriptional regulator [Halothiobacillus sp.]